MRITRIRTGLLAGLTAALGVAWGCGDSAGVNGDATVVATVSPAGGAVDVDPAGVVEVTFSRPMMAGMEAFAALHEGPVTGPEVDGTWAFLDGGTTMRFTPDAPLAPDTEYTIHLGGGMMDADGDSLNYDSCLEAHGGEWATGGMMSGGMMADRDMMGSGWRHANGMYGMLFTFRTQ